MENNLEYCWMIRYASGGCKGKWWENKVHFQESTAKAEVTRTNKIFGKDSDRLEIVKFKLTEVK